MQRLNEGCVVTYPPQTRSLASGPSLPFPFTEDDLATPHIESTNSSDCTEHGQIYGSRGLLPLGSTSVGTVLLLDDDLDFDDCVR